MLAGIEQFVKSYRAAGIPVFPLKPNKKEPATPHGVKDASTDPDAHADLFLQGCNVGMATGFVFDAIDLDGESAVRGFADKLDPDGDYSFSDFERCARLFEERIGPVVFTGHGLHVLCKVDPRRTNQSKLMIFGNDGIDYRTRGGYLVAPPSIHPNGKAYHWFTGYFSPTAMAPEWLPLRRGEEAANEHTVIDFSSAKRNRDCSRYQQKVLEQNIETLARATKGARNHTLNTCAFNIAQVINGNDAFEREAFVTLTNTAAEIGLLPREIAETLESAFRAGKKNAKQLDEPISSAPKKGNQQPSSKILLPDLVEMLCTDPDFSGLLGFDLLAQRIIKLRPQSAEAPSRAKAKYWGDYDSNILASSLAAKLGKNVPDKLLEQAIDIVAHRDERHPVRDYLDQCARAWDGRSRINDLLIALGAEVIKPHRLALAFWLAGAAARGCALEEEVKFDSMLVLEGAQGCGKSSVVAILGGEWAADTAFNLDSKDCYQQLGNAWIHEWAEMAAILKTTPERVKAFLSKSADDYREPYAHRQNHAIRHCAFIGTTNEDNYLRDDTGNRRYWPIACCENRRMIDLDWIRTAREQIWGEAMFLRRAYEMRGSGFAPMGDEIAIMAAYVQTRQQADELRDLVTNEIIRRFQSPGIVSNGWLDVEVGELMQAKEIKNEPSLSKLRLRRILKELGGREVRVATKTVATDLGYDFEGATNSTGRIRKFRFEHSPHSREDFDDESFTPIAIPSETA